MESDYKVLQSSYIGATVTKYSVCDCSIFCEFIVHFADHKKCPNPTCSLGSLIRLG